jgi:hypothetical protein
MPTISFFYGIAIRVYFRDHPPPHFHAAYGNDEAVIDMNSLQVRAGRLPPRAMSLVLEWARLHRADLLRAWDQVSRQVAPDQIPPLD